MKTFLSVCVLVAATSSAERFLDASPSLTALRVRCSADHDACRIFQSLNVGGSDNAYCATTPTEDMYESYCKSVKSCETSSSKMSGTIITIITPENLISNLDRPEVVNKIGGGQRRSMMNTLDYGSWACQSWSQLSDDHNKKLFGADGFAFDTETNSCYLLKLDGSESSIKSAAVTGIMSSRNCTAVQKEFKFTRFSALGDEASQIRGTCGNSPSDKSCKKVDAVDVNGNPGRCITEIQNNDCAVSEDVAEKCFSEVTDIVLPEKKKTVSSTESVKKFLKEVGSSFGDFAGHIGLTESDLPLGQLAKQFIPELSEEVACRNILLLRGIYKEFIAGIDASFYNSETKECHFFLQSDFDACQPGKEGNFVTGPDFC